MPEEKDWGYPAEEKSEAEREVSEEEKKDSKERKGKFRGLKPYHDKVHKYLREGIHQEEIIRRLREYGYEGSRSNAAYYVKWMRETYGIEAARRTSGRKAKGISLGEKYMTEKELMECIWRGKGFTGEERKQLKEKHPILLITERCVREFRQIFATQNMPLLYLFIEKYSVCSVEILASFAKGLGKDEEAVENAVASEKSNGFVEGINNLIKVIKRTMFGRCGRTLLSARLMLLKWQYT